MTGLAGGLADNGGLSASVVIDTSGNGTADWSVTKAAPLNVKWNEYGAKGDNATDDRVAIQAAITAAANAGGGEIYFPPGTYLSSKSGLSFDYSSIGLSAQPYSLLIPVGTTNNAPKITFLGAGRQQSKIAKTTLNNGSLSDYNLFASATVSGSQCAWVTFKDLALDGAQTAANTPFTVSDFHNIFIPYASFLQMDNCAVQNTRGGGVYLAWVERFRIHHSLITLVGWNTSNNGITITGGADLSATGTLGAGGIDHCDFLNVLAIGVSIGDTRAELDGVEIDHNTFTGNVATVPGSLGLELLSGNNTLKRPRVIGNTFEGVSGMTLQGLDAVVLGNTFYNMARATTNGKAIYCNNQAKLTRAQIAHNILDTGTDEGMYITGNTVSVMDNRVTGFATGIKLDVNATDCRVSNNRLDGNTTPIADSGTRTIREQNIVAVNPTVMDNSGAVPKSALTRLARIGAAAPSAAIAETFDRARVVASQTIVSGTLYLTSGPGTVLPGGVKINNLSFLCGGTALSGGTHQWFCLVDQALNVLAKTVDDTSTAWSAGSLKTLAITGGYTPTTDIAVYFGIVVTVTVTMPTITGIAASSGLGTFAPIMAGSSTASLTDPASLGSTAGAITPAGGVLYAYAS